MQIIKPLRIGYMSRPIADHSEARLALSGMICFDLLNPESLCTEQRLWEVVVEAVGEHFAFDQWVPKQNGEVLLWGAAHAPGAMPVAQMSVGLHVGDTVRKTIVVNGERQWKPTVIGAPRASDPLPFITLPLTQSCSYGGTMYPANPLGQGHDATRRINAGEVVKLPNLEYPGHPILHPNQEEPPARFLPVDINWPGHGPGGTYDDYWRKYCSPAVPHDYDWQAYNVAPADQRLSGFFRGDEAITLTGLNAEHPVINSRLPSMVVRFFVKREGNEALEAIDTVLDTVCLFPEALCGVLIYRGEICRLRDVEAQEISAVLSACEARGSQRTNAYYEEIFRLRTGEDRGLHALSDFQLMPSFSAANMARLDERRAEVKAEQAIERLKSDQWLAAYGQSLVGFSLPEGYFGTVADIKKQEKEIGADIPIITDLDRELGNVDMASLYHAMTQMEGALKAKTETIISAANIEFAKLDKKSEILRDIWQTGDTSRLDELSSSTGTSQPSTGDFANQILSIADRVENDPSFSIKQLSQILIVALLPDALPGLPAIEDCGPPAPAMLPEIRSQCAGVLRQIATSFANVELPCSENSLTSDAGSNDFLQSLGLGEGGVAKIQGGSASAGDLFQDMAEALRNAGSNDIGEVLAAQLGNLTGLNGNELASLKASFKQAEQAMPDLFRKSTELFSASAEPNSPVDMQQWLVDQLDTEKMIAAQLDTISDPAQRQVFEEQWRKGAEIQAQVIGKVAPEALDNGKVDWLAFLDGAGVGKLADEAPFSEFAEFSREEIESVEQQNLRRAKQLATGMPGIYRLGPDLPAETSEERRIAAVSEELQLLEDPEGEAQGNVFFTKILQTISDVEREAGGWNDQAISQLQEHVVADMHEGQGTVPNQNSSIAKKRDELLLSMAQGGMLVGHSIARKIIPDAEALLRKGRQAALAPMLRREEITPDIAMSVGDIVRTEAARGVSLAGRDLAGADLRGAQLAGLDLSGAFFDHADLTGADLTDARCEGAVFSGAILKRAKLCRAQLRQSNFGEALLQEADLSGADIREAKLFRADFSGANLSGARFDQSEGIGVVFRNANLEHSQCEGSTLINPDFSGASLRYARWHKVVVIKANLSGTKASDADLRECLFIDSNAEDCDFSRANLFAFNATGSCFKRLRASRAQADRSGWAKCDLSDADFSHARLEQSCFSNACLDRTDFSNSLLRRAMLLHTKLRNATLSGAQLFEAMLRGADLTDADLSHSNLHAADFENAVLDRCDLTGSRRIGTVLETPRAR